MKGQDNETRVLQFLPRFLMVKVYQGGRTLTKGRASYQRSKSAAKPMNKDRMHLPVVEHIAIHLEQQVLSAMSLIFNTV